MTLEICLGWIFNFFIVFLYVTLIKLLKKKQKWQNILLILNIYFNLLSSVWKY